MSFSYEGRERDVAIWFPDLPSPLPAPPVLALATLDAAVAQARTHGWPIGKSPHILFMGEKVLVHTWDGRLILETTRAGWDKMLSLSRPPSPESAARFNAALARDFYRHSLHGGFWWPA